MNGVDAALQMRWPPALRGTLQEGLRDTLVTHQVHVASIIDKQKHCKECCTLWPHSSWAAWQCLCFLFPTLFPTGL